MKEKMIKRMREITYKQRKSASGVNVYSGAHFCSPDCDGPALREFFGSLMPGQVLNITITVEEDQ